MRTSKPSLKNIYHNVFFFFFPFRIGGRLYVRATGYKTGRRLQSTLVRIRLSNFGVVTTALKELTVINPRIETNPGNMNEDGGREDNLETRGLYLSQ